MLFDPTEGDLEKLYGKYMQFNQVMLEEHTALEIASILTIQGLSFYRTFMDEDDYQRIVKSIYDQRDNVQTFD